MKRRGQIFILAVFFLFLTILVFFLSLPRLSLDVCTISSIQKLDMELTDTFINSISNVTSSYYNAFIYQLSVKSKDELIQDYYSASLEIFKVIYGENFNYKINSFKIDLRKHDVTVQGVSLEGINEVSCNIELTVESPNIGKLDFTYTYEFKVDFEEEYTISSTPIKGLLLYPLNITFNCQENKTYCNRLHVVVYIFNNTVNGAILSNMLKVFDGEAFSLNGTFLIHTLIPPEYVIYMQENNENIGIIVVIRNMDGVLLWFCSKGILEEQ